MRLGCNTTEIALLNQPELLLGLEKDIKLAVSEQEQKQELHIYISTFNHLVVCAACSHAGLRTCNMDMKMEHVMHFQRRYILSD